MSNRVAFFAATTAICLACDGSVEGPAAVETNTITVDASTSYAFIRLGTEAQLVSPSAPEASAEWDLAFFATTVTSNGGSAGPGGVSVACLCGPEPSVAELQARTAASELERFEAVTADDIPGGTEFKEDALAPVISDWFTNAGVSATANASRTFLIREGSSPALFTKMRVTQLQNPTAATPGRVTIEFATQSAAGGAFGATRSASITVGSARTYFDLTSGAITSASNWDIAFDGFAIRVNGGVSGNGSIRAVAVSTQPFDAVTPALAASVPANVYAADAYTGMFSSKAWYRYNITGTDNQIWPTYDIYIVRRGSSYYKVQLVGYYDAAGRSRQITVRYSPIPR